MPTDTAPDVSRRLTRLLTIWGGVSVVGGGVLALRDTTPGSRAFGLQSAMWGAIDVAIAAVATMQSTPATTDTLRRLLLVNTGLDAGYVAGGAYVVARTPDIGGRITAEQARGHGVAVIVQGAALFALDLTHARQLA